eukprot:scaffold8735_cov129-Isochrysis_galbana.AAC.7
MQRVGHDSDQLGRVDPDDPPLAHGGVDERPENIEDSAHTERLAHRDNVLHGRMEAGREHEGDAGLADASLDGVWLERQRYADFFQYIRRAAHRRHGAVAMLGHSRTA